MKLFDENEAVDFIRRQVKADNISDSQILEIIDGIYDYYEETGALDLDFDDDDDLKDCGEDEFEISEYIARESGFSDMDLLTKIVRAELDYEASLLDLNL